jgi:pimeloyl-ACP methyl ester carboxylesterase
VAEIARSHPPLSRFPLLPDVQSRMVPTPRLEQHIYERGTPDQPPAVLIHGNAASARFFEEMMARLAGWHVIAPDLRGYGASEAKEVDATRGLRDFSDDIHALIEELGIARFHLLGWSLGGNIAMQYVIDHPDRVLSLALQSTGSPYGYGCTHGPGGQPNFPDFAGSGAGVISPEVIARYRAKDASADSPFSPRSVLRALYVKPPFQFDPQHEDVLVEQMLLMIIGDHFYPGDSVTSANWPFTAPGVYGANNALSPKYLNQSGLATITRRPLAPGARLAADLPAILWYRGADDQIVSDNAMVDPGTLGKLGAIPGWPGDKIYPPQPMLGQIRAVLDAYASNGGSYREVVLPDCGHSPHIERPVEVMSMLQSFWRSTSSAAQTTTGKATQERRSLFDRIFRRT